MIDIEVAVPFLIMLAWLAFWTLREIHEDQGKR